MIIKKTRHLAFNMGHYEKTELFATVEVDTIADHDDLMRDYNVDTHAHDDVIAFITETLDEIEKTEVTRVKDTSDNEDSFVYPYSDVTTTHKK